MSEIRQNRLTGEWVIIAPERAKRGGNLPPPQSIPQVLPYTAECPFCPGNEEISGDDAYRLDGAQGQWAVRSVMNKFSVLSPKGEVALSEENSSLGQAVNGVGLHEVIVENPRHDRTIALSTVADVTRILEAYQDRFRAFYEDPRVRHVIIFKNHGADAGASQQHPHSQIVGLPIIPRQVDDRIERSRRFFSETGQCLACHLMHHERTGDSRIVAENDDFVAFIPYAALSPYHMWIFPKEHMSCFSALPRTALEGLAEILRSVLARVHSVLGNPPYNLVVRSLGPADPETQQFHWYVSVVPRVNKTGGFELGTGIYINPSVPETSAQQLREHRVS